MQAITIEMTDHEAAPLYLKDKQLSDSMLEQVESAQQHGDSIGGVVGCIINNPPLGLGEPIYDKLEAKLAYAMLSIPASKGFEIGAGFSACTQTGSQHNDSMHAHNGDSHFTTNHAGGTLGGISTGEPIYCRVGFKPTSSIKQPQQTTNTQHENVTLTLDHTARHDPCVAIRAIPVVSAMASCVIADCLLLMQTSRMQNLDFYDN